MIVEHNGAHKEEENQCFGSDLLVTLLDASYPPCRQIHLVAVERFDVLVCDLTYGTSPR